ncbi:signal peptidase I [Bradyrhizobium sp. U87765 SZCCT0131]|uniref:signal peptidase I n=1 Tax=unclassified Bradyrhizobium TaxID=2631580 RepID=UPI001BAA691E|nr:MULTISPECIES: signal peptidase I [unclassified Bradyrhizobium]MBR1221000.1 signal peptidase I [Bradyrhizobium sp. U87765 SZCCT0131]MBR1260180.1 signal peptidase I [Bradyrhizobium sp. U87765 SZCCT0134]MBR1307571.1 signal peptidase I [Bradyrhizobium sp. U87765 SZCCT0110]MBR1321525.1 signal peptidase I [Bradyrhizobium sp. U87765 SZCCT0109]MBR1349838.1 signal peptidase I [Bradyrhizobium sp. U87765 SZCCT0048]
MSEQTPTLNTTTSFRKTVVSWAGALAQMAAVFAVVMAAKGALAEPFYVPSGSMEPTLMIGDALLATKYPYGYSAASVPLNISLPSTSRVLGALPERGDVVVFRWPGDRAQVWVKRVVGLPGDRIQMRNGQLFINGIAAALQADGVGKAETENGAEVPAPRYVETLPGNRSHPIFKLRAHGFYDNTAEVTVPSDHLFVMGDNRDNSADSRVPVADGGVGMLPTANLVGRVEAVLGSWDLAQSQQPVTTWLSGLRPSRFMTGVN